MPFRENTDPTFLWLGPPNRDAFNTLRTGVLENAGVLLLTGDVGTGKTMLAGAIAESLRAEGVRVEKLLHSDLSAHEFRYGVAEAFELPTRSNVRATFFEQVTEFLEAAHTRGEKMLLIIDEAHGFGTVLLDEIEELVRAGRTASGDTINVMNVLLVSHTDIEAEVIAVRAHLTPLEPKHVADYIAFRLRVAGGDRELFTDDAIRGIAAMSGGVPRVINRVCDCALQLAADRNEAVVTAEIVREVPDALGFTTVANEPIAGVDDRPRTRATMKRIAYLAAGVLLVAAGAVAYQGLGRVGSVGDWKPRAVAPPSAPTLGASRVSPAGPSVGDAGAALPQATTDAAARRERPAAEALKDVRPVSVPAEARDTVVRSTPAPPPAAPAPVATRAPAVEARPASPAPAPAVETRPAPPAPAPAVEVRPTPPPPPPSVAAQPAPGRRPASAPVAATTPATSPVTTSPQVTSPPAARSADEAHDPSAIINWLLQRRNAEEK